MVVAQTVDGPRIRLVHRQRHGGGWSLPKGKLRTGETHLVAAVRETFEETGLEVRLGPPVGAIRYGVDGRPKEVRYWRATEIADKGVRTGTEVDASAWFDLDAAHEELTHDNERQVALAATELAQTAPLVIVRHTAARSRDEWPAADPDRPLDDRGNHDAVRLGRLIATWAPGRVICSPSRRCVESITPYAARVAARVELEPLLSEEEHARRPDELAPLLDAVVADLRWRLAGPSSSADTPRRPGTVLCTHRPVLPAIADVLGVQLAGSDRAEPLPPGGCWVLHLSSGGLEAIEEHAV